MRLGVDFGTTRIVVAAVDRGNYPVVTFDCPDGEARDWFPPLVAVRGEERRYGWRAWELQAEPGWTIVRSLKRTLEDAGPGTLVEMDGQTLPLLPVLQEMVTELRQQLIENSTLKPGQGEPLDVMLGVPANANSNQRFLTVEAFRLGGFQTVGLLNEPSAASIEFGHRSRESKEIAENSCVLVYDLGGGTFDVSLVEMDGRTHTVIASEGIPTLGGDDFDEVLARLALDVKGGPALEQLSQGELFRLMDECRVKKEALHPNTRKITVDLDPVREGWGQVTIPVNDYYDRCRPLVDETLHAVQDVLQAHGFAADGSSAGTERRLESVYVAGGSSDLPVVARMLREQFGRRMKRSAHTRAATAIGLAIQADASQGYVLREQFTRHFGVWREADSGRVMTFDPLFAKGTQLPAPGEPELADEREYLAVHNVAHFRYTECSQRSDSGQPTGDLAVWDEVLFPVEPALSEQPELHSVPVERQEPERAQRIQERYSCDASGTVSVTIRNLSAGYERHYRLGRWAGKDAPVVPGRRKKKKAAAER